MEKTTLSLKSLHLVSEELTEDFNRLFESAVKDCTLRPTLQKARTVKIEVSIVPDEEDLGDVHLDGVCSLKTPDRRVSPVRLQRKPKSNQLQFEFEDDLL